MGDGVGIADAGHADIALADLARAFELDPELGGRDELHAGDAGGLVGDLVVVAMGHVEHAAGDEFVERVGALVHRVARDRGDGAALPGLMAVTSTKSA
jgi:hypothetical protein